MNSNKEQLAKSATKTTKKTTEYIMDADKFNHETETDIPVIFHADDFGINYEQSKHILECSICGSGVINSLSVMVGSPYFEECACLLDGHTDELLVGLHFNLTEGPAVVTLDGGTPPTNPISLLVDNRGFYRNGFGALLAYSYGPKRKIFVEQVAQEAQAQIERFVERFPQFRHNLRIDSHQHIHLIPGVFEGLLLGIDRSGCTLSYMRIPTEPTRAFKEAGVSGSLRVINKIKRLTLNTLYRFDGKYLIRAGLKQSSTASVQSGLFCGVSLSGCMDYDRVEKLLPVYRQYATERGFERLEFLFHPGGLSSAGECLDERLSGHVAFYLDEGRAIESLATQKLA